MKSTIRVAFAALALCLTISASGQAMFWLNNGAASVNAPVFDASGARLEGTSYVAELWGGPTAGALQPAVAAYSQERVFAPFVAPGFFLDLNPVARGNPTVFSVPPYYQPAALQVRVWDTRLGATYDEVATLGMGGYGESAIFYAIGADPFLVNPALPAYLLGLQSFSLHPVPEPPTWALLTLSGIGFWWTTRRKRVRERTPHCQPF